ncbi:J domain-containing protein [Vibrio hangzhouensis]|uniref:J domain-containing protein n=1 Tax=Vibrio hangzhouensis TaxID=462991 RepID=UPI001C951154|nr:J domain-containing protein [Vibrio hangzhouensis]MBY6196571.1 J domain-containing protein [Vibrio hangzhouensis]
MAIFLLLPFQSNASVEQLQHETQLNNAEAQYKLGLAYETGEGTQRDLTLAAHWYKQASDNGHPAATYNYAQALEYGRGIQANPSKAVLLYTRLAALGEHSTYSKIARLYQSHDIQIANEDQAVLWYSLAKDLSPEYDSAYAQALQKQFDAQQLRQIQALEQQEQAASTSSHPLTTRNIRQEPSNSNWILHLSYLLALLTILVGATIMFRTHQRRSTEDPRHLIELQQKLSQQQQLIKKLYKQLSGSRESMRPVVPSKADNTALSDAYQRFGFSPVQTHNLTPKLVKMRYKQLCRIYHPDAQGSDEEMKLLNLAFEVIVNHLKKTQKIH